MMSGTVGPSRRLRLDSRGLCRPLLLGGLAALGMASIYVVVVTLAQGWRDAVVLFTQDLPLTAPIAMGFGTQIGLYVHLRGLVRRRPRATGAMVGATGGTSAASMVACCAHRVADLLPVLGASAVASFLAAYKVPFMAIGLAMNVVGVAILLGRITRLRRQLATGSSVGVQTPEKESAKHACKRVLQLAATPRPWLRAAVFIVAIACLILAVLAALLGEWLAAAVSTAVALAADRAGRVWSRRSPIPFPYWMRWLLVAPRVLLSPARVRKALQPRSGERILEIGPGVGSHAVSVASSLVPGGVLEVVDVQQEMLGAVARRAAGRRLTNVVPRRADASELPYPDNLFDGAYLIGVLGEIRARSTAIRELRRVLKDSGRLLIGEFLFDPDFVPLRTLKGLTRDAGFTFERKLSVGLAYSAIFRPTRISARSQVDAAGATRRPVQAVEHPGSPVGGSAGRSKGEFHDRP